MFFTKIAELIHVQHVIFTTLLNHKHNGFVGTVSETMLRHFVLMFDLLVPRPREKKGSYMRGI